MRFLLTSEKMYLKLANNGPASVSNLNPPIVRTDVRVAGEDVVEAADIEARRAPRKDARLKRAKALDRVKRNAVAMRTDSTTVILATISKATTWRGWSMVT